MKLYAKLITMIPVLIFLFSSMVYAQTDVKKNEKEIGPVLIDPDTRSIKGVPKQSGFDQRQINSSQKREGSNENSVPKPTQPFTGSGPARARDNPDG